MTGGKHFIVCEEVSLSHSAVQRTVAQHVQTMLKSSWRNFAQ